MDEALDWRAPVLAAAAWAGGWAGTAGLPALAGGAAALAALIGASIDSQDLAKLDFQLRAVCGVLVSTPQLMLGGLAPKDTRVVPRLTPADAGYQVLCDHLAASLTGASTAYVVTCGAASVTVTGK